jgi:hypothetical protein
MNVELFIPHLYEYGLFISYGLVISWGIWVIGKGVAIRANNEVEEKICQNVGSIGKYLFFTLVTLGVVFYFFMYFSFGNLNIYSSVFLISVVYCLVVTPALKLRTGKVFGQELENFSGFIKYKLPVWYISLFLIASFTSYF